MTVCAMATDAADADMLLRMLGIHPAQEEVTSYVAGVANLPVSSI